MERLFEAFRYYLEGGHLQAYILALAAGIATSFTPCVYPVIPITISYIGANAAGNKSKGFFLSASYVLGIAVTYSILGGIAALTGRLFGQIAASPVAYAVIANICILLALSMLGVFNIPIPGFLNRMAPNAAPNRASGLSGMLSAFFVGLASGLIVGPCTAPVLAVILGYVASRQNLIYGSTILFTYALGMGFILVLVGTFTGLLVSLPKAGPWLERVKKGFGLLLLLVGEYFLYVAGRLSF